MDPSTTNPYWSRPIEEPLSDLGTSEAGLSEATARVHLARYGPNRIKEHRNKQGWRLLLGQFASPLVLILVFAVAVSMAAAEWIDAVIILAIVAGSGVRGFVQEYSAGAALERLRARVTLKATVVRGGRAVEIPTANIVPGDLLALSAGSLVPADAVLVRARDFFVNQAVLTGEPFPVEKMPGPVSSAAEIAADGVSAVRHRAGGRVGSRVASRHHHSNALQGRATHGRARGHCSPVRRHRRSGEHGHSLHR